MHSQDNQEKIQHHTALITKWLAESFSVAPEDVTVTDLFDERQRSFRFDAGDPKALHRLRVDEDLLSDSWDDQEILTALDRRQIARLLEASAKGGGYVTFWWHVTFWWQNEFQCMEPYDK